MIDDDDAPLGDQDFEDALATARDGFAIDWAFPDPVMAALEVVLNDPTDANVEAARATWRAEGISGRS
jgi:hypothetical protein